MYVIVGLGNPEMKYDNTRHNVGFACVDSIAKEYGIKINEAKFKAFIGKGVIDGEKVILMKPITYMNNSGEAVRQIVDFFKLDSATEVCIIYDDTSMDLGKVRIRKKGSAGGHNGIKSIISHLGSDTFVRIKVGIGSKPENVDLVNHVLGYFKSDEKKVIEETATKLCDAVKLMVHGDVDEAMNRFNG